jgi:tol-pal system protein YbgF
MKRIVTVLLFCVALTACVKADDVRTLDNRVYEQKLRIDELQGKVDQMAAVEPEKADTWSQVQSMRQELAQAKGDLETLSRDVAALRARVEAGEEADAAMGEDLKDIKTGWQRLNSQLATDVDLAAIRAERTAVPVAMADANATMADAAANATVTDAPAQAEAAPAKPAPASVNADAASTLYKSARAAFEARDYRQGIALWDEFVSTFGEHKLVPNALFWQGECYYQMKDYARAVLKYQVVIDKYKKSTKYPTALLKQGISFMRLGRVKAGKLLLKDVADKFPKIPEGKRAASILKQVD